MRLFRFGNAGSEKPGLVDEAGVLRDVSGFGSDYDEAFLGGDGLARLSGWASSRLSDCPVVPEDVRIGPPVPRPSKIICIGLNFSDHAAESGMELPAEPVVFFKATSAFCGPGDDLILPRGGDKTDWEVELALVIGKKAQYVDEAEAMDHIAGFCLHNDYSERAFQLERCGQWVKGKSCDTFAPLGPELVTPDGIRDVNNLRMWLSVNGEMLQDSTTANLHFKVPYLVSYLSQFMTLLPGDVISSGTPPGVGLGLKPPRFLKAGDVVELGIDGLGQQRQVVRPSL